MASSSKLRRAASVSDTGAAAVLPADAQFEVLLRLPAKDLCRLRAVCRSWRALTYDPHFAAVHKSRHVEPLFAVTFWGGDGARGVAIVGLSGQVLRRIPFASDPIELLLTHLDRLCVFRWCKPSLGAWVLNPATAVVVVLPGVRSDEFVGICMEHNSGCVSCLTHTYMETVTYAFGQVASTREYKVLRISHPNCSPPQLCDIITLDGCSQERWRRKQNPPNGLMRTQRGEIKEHLTVNGVVYFLLDYAVMGPASTAPFNLDTEKWMPTLRGPEPLRSADFRPFKWEIKLAKLNGSLVIFDNDAGVSFDLWFLMDHNIGLWVKKYSVVQDCFYARPLLILDDGRIVIYDRVERLLQCYDPTTDSLADVLDIKEMGMGLGETQSIGVYTGSLLI